MLRGRDGAMFDGCSHEGAAGEVACTAEHAAGALVNSRDGIRSEERHRAASDGDMVGEVVGHVIALECLHVAAADDARGCHVAH